MSPPLRRLESAGPWRWRWTGLGGAGGGSGGQRGADHQGETARFHCIGRLTRYRGPRLHTQRESSGPRAKWGPRLMGALEAEGAPGRGGMQPQPLLLPAPPIEMQGVGVPSSMFLPGSRSEQPRAGLSLGAHPMRPPGPFSGPAV